MTFIEVVGISAGVVLAIIIVAVAAFCLLYLIASSFKD